jgi:hypothetical protein
MITSSHGHEDEPHQYPLARSERFLGIIIGRQSASIRYEWCGGLGGLAGSCHRLALWVRAVSQRVRI